jgi:WD40-like Beta Propeller Repeat/Fibronectin type III domain
MQLFRYFIFCVLVLGTACSSGNDIGTRPDAIPPLDVDDLSISDSTYATATLIWTSPGDDGADGQAFQYDVRYSTELFSESWWDSATACTTPPVPKAAGEAETLLVSGLDDGLWHFGVRTADEVPNWSEISNIVSVTHEDNIPPADITDLEATLATMATITLSWTAPGDNANEGQVFEYDFRYSTVLITEENWVAATRLGELHPSGPAGGEESATVVELETGTTYYFAVKAIDDMQNESAISNVLEKSTAYIEQLTFSPDRPVRTGAYAPKWSPDGLYILFVADWGKNRGAVDLYKIPSVGGEPERLTYDPDRVSAGCWHPNSHQVAFSAKRNDNPEIFEMDAVSGAEMIQRTNFDGSLRPWGLAYSPSGSKLAFTHSPWPGPINYVYTISLAGGGADLFTSGSKVSSLNWLPNRTKIIFDDYTNGISDIHSAPVSSGIATQLTDGTVNDRLPAVSPDGSKIAFVSDRSGDFNLWMMSVRGTDLVQLTFDSDKQYSPSWSPDGKRIAFSSYEGDISDIRLLVME